MTFSETPMAPHRGQGLGAARSPPRGHHRLLVPLEQMGHVAQVRDLGQPRVETRHRVSHVCLLRLRDCCATISAWCDGRALSS
jgi:hypothetical protein